MKKTKTTTKSKTSHANSTHRATHPKTTSSNRKAASSAGSSAGSSSKAARSGHVTIEAPKQAVVAQPVKPPQVSRLREEVPLPSSGIASMTVNQSWLGRTLSAAMKIPERVGDRIGRGIHDLRELPERLVRGALSRARDASEGLLRRIDPTAAE